MHVTVNVSVAAAAELVTVRLATTVSGLAPKAPTDGSYLIDDDGWLKLWDEGTQTYRKCWLRNGALEVE